MASLPSYFQHVLPLPGFAPDAGSLSLLIAERRRILAEHIAELCLVRPCPSVLVIGYGCSSEIGILLELYERGAIRLAVAEHLSHVPEQDISDADLILSSRLLDGAADGLVLTDLQRVLRGMSAQSHLLLPHYRGAHGRAVAHCEESVVELLADAVEGCRAHFAWSDGGAAAVYFEIVR